MPAYNELFRHLSHSFFQDVRLRRPKLLSPYVNGSALASGAIEISSRNARRNAWRRRTVSGSARFDQWTSGDWVIIARRHVIAVVLDQAGSIITVSRDVAAENGIRNTTTSGVAS